jgi:alpha-amylase/alpha-mannosidase (GH57 family)
MKWANFLHIYQPSDQQPDILEAVVEQSYRPVLSHIVKSKNAKLTINITGSLLELFDKYGYQDLIEMMKIAGKAGKIEFTGSAKYHAFLPFLNDEDIKRQIIANDETCRYYLGEAYKPKGFFPPEMAYKRNLVPILESLGFEWIILDEIAMSENSNIIDYNKIYTIKNSSLKVFFRERRLSNLIMGSLVRSKETLLGAMEKELQKPDYIITAMDEETFGHHRPGLESMLFDILDDPIFNLVTISELIDLYDKTQETEPSESTWASSKSDIEKGIQFLSWTDPSNPIHALQWRLFNLVSKEVKKINSTDKKYKEIIKDMDIASASDHFWWASAKPWWSLEMIELGAYRLLKIMREIPDIKDETLLYASSLYKDIVSIAFEWQRSGKVRRMVSEQQAILRIPFKDRTFGRGGAEEGVYCAFIDMMKQLENDSVKKKEYEKAILWRDAIFKLENKLDIYDTINVIDMVRTHIPNEEVEKTIEKYKEQYRKIRGGQPEQRGS